MTSGAKSHRKHWLDVGLNVFAPVRRGEAGTALLLALNLFLLLCAYYIIKPVRDQLIIDVPGGAELKAYSSGASALALLVFAPLYGMLVDRMHRNRLIIAVTVFFTLCLVGFAIAVGANVAPVVLAIAFYLFTSVFSMTVVAQVWGFANDIYTEEQGKRLFAIVGLGASLGAVLGGVVVSVLQGASLFALLLLAAVIVLGTAGLTQVIHAREHDPETTLGPPAANGRQAVKNALSLVLNHRYLVALATFSLLFTLVNSNGEYMISKLVKEAHSGAEIRAFFAQYYSGVNLLSLLIQALLVSRVVKGFGLERAFFFFPVIVLCTSVTLGLAPVLAIISITKRVENSTDYSLNNTLRNMLWLPTTREMKYKAKQVVDTFMVRLGDVTTAVLIAGLSAVELLSVRGMAWINAGLSVAWLLLACLIVGEYRRMQAQTNVESRGVGEVLRAREGVRLSPHQRQKG
jgi:AAA family ATP:ADP antiporter